MCRKYSNNLRIPDSNSSGSKENKAFKYKIIELGCFKYVAIQKRLSKAPQLISSSSPPAAGLKDSLQFLSFNFQLFSKKLQHPQKRKVGLNGKLCKEECAVVGADAQQLHCKVSVGGRGGGGGLNCCHTWSFIQR